MLPKIDLTKDQIEGILVLCKKYGVVKLSIFGSGARGEYEEGKSDYDFLVEFSVPSGMSLAEQYFGLKESLKGLLKTEVDLVEDQAVKNPYFRLELNERAVQLYAA